MTQLKENTHNVLVQATESEHRGKKGWSIGSSPKIHLGWDGDYGSPHICLHKSLRTPLTLSSGSNHAIDTISAKLLVGITRNHNRQKDTLVTRAGSIIDAKSLSSADLLKIVINKHIRYVTSNDSLALTCNRRYAPSTSFYVLLLRIEKS